MTDDAGSSPTPYSPLPTGVTVLHYDGDGPTPVQRLLAASPSETDPEREGIRLLLAGAVAVLPPLALDELVMVARHVIPQLRQFDPATVADVARALGVA